MRIFAVNYVESDLTTEEVTYIRAIDKSEAKRLFTQIGEDKYIRNVVCIDDVVINPPKVSLFNRLSTLRDEHLTKMEGADEELKKDISLSEVATFTVEHTKHLYAAKAYNQVLKLMREI